MVPVRFVLADVDSHFVFSGIVPGDYRLMAWEYLDRDNIDDERIRQVKKQGTAVHVVEATSETVVLVPVPAAPAGQ